MNTKDFEISPIQVVDSHAHINIPEFDDDRRQLIHRSFEEGVESIHCPAEITEPDRLEIALKLSDEFPQISVSAGVHPHAAKDFLPRCLETIRDLSSTGSIVAVGEIGLDFHYNFSSKEAQLKTFRDQLAAAEKFGLPVVIHSRLAGAEVHQCVSDTKFSRGGVLHCYTEDWEFAKKMLDLGFYISFSGILTFPKAQDLREAVSYTHLTLPTN